MESHNITYKQDGQLVAVDCIIFGYDNEKLKLLLFNRRIEPSKGKLSLLGGWVQNDESVEDATRRVLRNITGLEDIFMDLVGIFSKVDRDPGGRVISIAYYALLPINEQNNKTIEENNCRWYNFEGLPSLIFDHNEMVRKALQKLRSKANEQLIGEKLLPDEFTILQLRKVYNAIYQCEFDPGNFRKKILSLKVLEQLNSKDTSESKRGAYHYRFKANKKLPASGKIFMVDF